MCTNNSFDKAYSTALDSTLRQFEDSIKKLGTDSLFPNDTKEVEIS
jgi:hypothetical protein